MSDDKDVSKLADELLAKQPPVEDVEMLPLGDIYSRSSVEWLWPGYVPLRKLTMLEARGGAGKTRFIQALAALGSRGSLPFGESEEGVEFDPWSTLFLGTEDEPEELYDTFEDSGGVRDRLFWWDEDRLGGITFDFEGKGAEQLRNVIRGLNTKGKNVRLVAIDPILEFCPSGFNPNDNAAIKKLLKPLSNLARSENVSILFNRHLRKGIVGVDISERGSGAEGWRNSARQQLHLFPRDDNSKTRFETLIISMRNANRIVYGEPFAYCIAEGRIFFKSPSQVDCQRYVDAEPQLARYFKGVAPKSKGTRGPESVVVQRAKEAILLYLQENGATHSRVIRAALEKKGHNTRRIYDARQELLDAGLLTDSRAIWAVAEPSDATTANVAPNDPDYDPFADGFRDTPTYSDRLAGLDD